MFISDLFHNGLSCVGFYPVTVDFIYSNTFFCVEGGIYRISTYLIMLSASRSFYSSFTICMPDTFCLLSGCSDLDSSAVLTGSDRLGILALFLILKGSLQVLPLGVMLSVGFSCMALLY